MAGGGSLRGDPKLRTPMSWTGRTGTAGFTTGTPYRLAVGQRAATFNVAAQAGRPRLAAGAVPRDAGAARRAAVGRIRRLRAGRRPAGSC
ncbi:MAG: hypothetical protein MZW92_66500 [Comamonadaceae bacterium]|nr:hypothetical protein [Comamonadaceae bacterium]